MEEHAILTAIGADRPGLVDEVSRFIFERGGNLADSRMVNLRGQFAMMVLFGGEAKTIGRIRSELWQLAQASGLQAEVRPAGEVGTGTASGGAGDSLPYRLTATAIDQPGLVHRFASVLRELAVNIESMDTRLTAAPYTGAPMFEMEMILSVPRKTALADIRQRLSVLSDELNIDFLLGAV